MAEEKTVEPPSGNMKMIIMAVVAVLLMIGFGVGGYFFGVKSGDSAMAPADPAPVAQEVEAPVGIGPLVAVNDIIVNLLDDQETHYLKASLSLEMDSPEAVGEVEERQPQVRDAVLLLLGSKTFAELRDLQGKLQLRAELMERLNGFLQTGKVKTIFFTDFVVQ